MLLSMATGAAPGGFGGFDVNQWNQQRVDERADRSRDLGNVIHFCRWREIERMIDALSATSPADATIH